MAHLLFEKEIKPRSYLPLLFFIVLAIFAGVYYFMDEPVPVQSKNGSYVVAFGDSLVAGYGVSKEENFVSKLSNSVGEPIINSGISGDKTGDALARVHADVIRYNPKIVILLFGGNDILSRSISTKEMSKNLKKIIDLIHSEGSAVVLVGVRAGVFQDSFDEMYKEIAQEKKTYYVPNILGGLISNDEYMIDVIHPNAKGHEMMAEKIEPVLLKALKGEKASTGLDIF